MLVQWKEGIPESATWEFLFDLQVQYPDNTLKDKGVAEGKVLMQEMVIVRELKESNGGRK